MASANFGFLAKHDPIFLQIAEAAERSAFADPNSTLVKTRQLAEAFARHAAAAAGVWTGPQVSQADLLRELDRKGYLDRQVLSLFHSLRRAGNEAVHDFTGSRSQAVESLRIARLVAVWFHRVFGPPGSREFKPGPFVPPPDPTEPLRKLEAEVARLQAQLDASEKSAAAAQALATAEASRRAEEEALRHKAEEDRKAAEELVDEAQRKLNEAEARFESALPALQAQASAQPASALNEQKNLAVQVAGELDLDEADTRAIIDAQLREAGWEADSVNFRYSLGARPEPGKMRAISEWPTLTGPADYVLFHGLTPLGIVEAKRQAKNVSASVDQAKRYSAGFKVLGDVQLPRPQQAPESFEGWDSGETLNGNALLLKIPFLFATNGRPHHRQFEVQSGIWFRDVRATTNHARPLEGWYTPEALLKLLDVDVAGAHQKLREEPTGYLDLRDYQVAAIRAIEEAIARGQRNCLVAMATGTGKTRTTIGLIYRLIKAKRFRRVLFLVDRTTLGTQARDAFREMRLEQGKVFTDIYDLRELADAVPTEQTRVQLATVQAMVKRIFRPEDGQAAPPIDQYDCIVVDESHRGYTLDRQLNEGEETYRDFRDYLSTYRRVLDHFDAVKIGLTATPALHTREIFGDPVFSYTYREAVADGHLVDHEPPVRYVTRLAQHGIRFPKGSQVEVTVGAGQRDFWKLDDELHFEIDAFNRTVITEGFNRAVCAELAKDLDPHLEEKTLIFAANDEHADLVVHLLKQALSAKYPDLPDAAVMKITGATDDVEQVIRRYKNDRWPNIAVTVDLLTTGIDVPAIANLVFLRRVRSRILFEQMMGRATRPCTFSDNSRKAVFHIYDAVDLYAALEPVTDMKPLVKDLNVPAGQLLDEVADPKTHFVPSADGAGTQADDVLRQLVERLRRRIRRSEGTKAQVDESFRKAKERIEAILNEDLARLPDVLRRRGAADIGNLLRTRPELRDAIELLLAPGQVKSTPKLISTQADELLSRVKEYPGGRRPEDYLEAFRTFVKSNQNIIPVLNLVVSKPSALTRKQLKELRLKLDTEGFDEKSLENAVADVQKTNAGIAANIMGLIRQQALGSPLKPYGLRVDEALQKITASRAWTAAQRRWLENFALQLKNELVIDRDALDAPPFKQKGGFNSINRVFDEHVLEVLEQLQAHVWADEPQPSGGREAS